MGDVLCGRKIEAVALQIYTCFCLQNKSESNFSFSKESRAGLFFLCSCFWQECIVFSESSNNFSFLVICFKNSYFSSSIKIESSSLYFFIAVE